VKTSAPSAMIGVGGARHLCYSKKMFGTLSLRNLAPFGLVSITVLAAGCSPHDDPPPDPLKVQREALEKAKAVEKTIMQADQNARKNADDASK
jgi:hypothetical protein